MHWGADSASACGVRTLLGRREVSLLLWGCSALWDEERPWRGSEGDRTPCLGTRGCTSHSITAG